MNWIELTSFEDLDTIIAESEDTLVGIFKHSTRCIISRTVLRRFEKSYSATDKVKMYYLDLLNYRELSNEIESKFNVLHQSPQLLLVDKRNVVKDASHERILNVNIENFLK